MRVVVCIRRLSSGELNPFDACAYEAALRLQNAEVTLLSMGPASVKDFLLGLTRLGAKKGILLSDSAFAGADTLATSYALSLALNKLSPDLIICGRQAIDGDTGQVGPEIATMLNIPLVTNLMSLETAAEGLKYTTRDGISGNLTELSLVTVERINTLRLPSIRSKVGEVEVWSADDIGADKSRCGLAGSPTRVLKTFKNDQDRRKCKFIEPENLKEIIDTVLNTPRIEIQRDDNGCRLKNVWIIGESPRAMAETVSDTVTVVPLTDAETITAKIKAEKPEVVLWGSDLLSKRVAPEVAARLNTGLCADCTLLETDGQELYMYRPAFSGDIIAKIKCLTRPQMATVRTLSEMNSRVAIGVGFGAKDLVERVKTLAGHLNAEVVASRKTVDYDFLPYENQVGLTGKSVNPDVYIALGVSGAVHHIAGVKQSGTIIAVNTEREAPIFDFADYEIVASADDVLKILGY